MIDKILISNKLEKFFNKTTQESFIKIFIISFLYDKVSYIEKIVGYENTLNMLDKYIYNLEKNVQLFKKTDNYHSIYVRYDFKAKILEYNIVNDYKKAEISKLSENEKKDFLIKEFKIMMYAELDKIINIYVSNGKIISNGFYLNDSQGRYPDYEGDFSNIIDIFSDVEICNITKVNDRNKIYVEDTNNFFVYSKHNSKRNDEVINYVDLWKKFIDDKLFYFAVNNPKKYTEKMINNFNIEYQYVLKSNYNFLLKSDDVFSLLEKYLLHIRERVNIENNLRYHQDLSVIFKLMNNYKNIDNFVEYVLHSESKNEKLDFENI